MDQLPCSHYSSAIPALVLCQPGKKGEAGKRLEEKSLFPHYTSSTGKMKIKNTIFTECSADDKQTLAKVWRLNSKHSSNFLSYPDFNEIL